MLATYWSARYFVPVIVSLWMAKQARKHWGSVSAVVVLAASYVISMAVSYRLLAGPTTTIKLYYPLFSGKVAIPRLVAKWIRHNNNLASFLTKMVSMNCFALVLNTKKDVQTVPTQVLHHSLLVWKFAQIFIAWQLILG